MTSHARLRNLPLCVDYTDERVHYKESAFIKRGDVNVKSLYKNGGTVIGRFISQQTKWLTEVNRHAIHTL